MALKYGTNFLASDIAKGLEKNDKQKEGIRTWSQLFGNASLGFGAQSDAITSDYASAMREAYTANFNQRNTILTGGLSQGHTQQALGLSQQDLSDTYERFVTNYSKDINTAAQSYGSEVSAISGDLTTRAENFSKLFSSAYDYLSGELYGSTLTDKTDFSDPIYTLDDKGKPTGEISGYNQRQLDYLEEKGLDWLYTGEDDERRLMDWEEASKLLFDENNELTEEGIRFYDQMYNARPEGYLREDGTNARSFDSWLSETDADLREWMLSSDDFNYNFAGTNRGTANIMTGRESIDSKEDTPESILLSAQKTGYSNFVKKINSSSRSLDNETWYSKDMNIDPTASKNFKNESFNEFFAGIEDALDGGISSKAFSDYSQGINRYLSEYKSIAKTELSTFKSELNSLLGSAMGNEFWQEYGGEIDALYEKISTWQNVERYKKPGSFGNWGDEGDKSHLSRMLQDVRNLQKSGFNEAFSRLQSNLQKYINQKRVRNKTQTSGF